MRVSCHSNLLREGVSTVQSIAQSKISNPLVESILIRCAEGRIEFLATDMNIDVRFWGEATVEEPGEIVVRSKIAQDLVRELYEETTVIESTESGARFRCGAGDFTLQTLDPGEFPGFKPVQEGSEIAINGELLHSAFRRTVFATTTEESRFELDGVKLDLKSNQLVFVASDGRRLSKVTIPGNELETRGAVVPTRAVDEILRILTAEGNAKMVIGEKKVMVEGENFALVAGLLRDKFPPYEQIIPSEFKVVAHIDNDDFLHGVRSATVMARERGQMIAICFENGQATFSGEHKETGAAQYACPVDYDGEKFEIAYRSMFLLDYLKAVGAGRTKMQMIDQQRASVFVPSEMDDFLHLIMPMRIEKSAKEREEEGEEA